MATTTPRPVLSISPRPIQTTKPEQRLATPYTYPDTLPPLPV